MAVRCLRLGIVPSYNRVSLGRPCDLLDFWTPGSVALCATTAFTEPWYSTQRRQSHQWSIPTASWHCLQVLLLSSGKTNSTDVVLIKPLAAGKRGYCMLAIVEG